MRLAVLANEEQQEEFLPGTINDDISIDFISSIEELDHVSTYDVLFDLLFEENGNESSHVRSFLPKPVIVNAVNTTTGEIGLPLVRINGWPGFLKRNIAEVSCADLRVKKDAAIIFNALNKKPEWVPDVKGFISARVVSMIINEAYFAFEDNVSTKDEIDLAMKLGTNYPYGPFEWAKKIGIKKIARLLTALSLSEKRYQPAASLLTEAIG